MKRVHPVGTPSPQCVPFAKRKGEKEKRRHKRVEYNKSRKGGGNVSNGKERESFVKKNHITHLAVYEIIKSFFICFFSFRLDISFSAV